MSGSGGALHRGQLPHLFEEYERLDVHAVLLSVMVDDAMRAEIGRSYAALFGYWVGYSVPAQYGSTVPSGIAAPGGRWVARCPAQDRPAWRSSTSTRVLPTTTSASPSTSPVRGGAARRTACTVASGRRRPRSEDVTAF